MSAREMAIMTVPQQQCDNNGCNMESEFYCNNFVMPVMNKIYGDMRSSDTDRL